jgi:uncharacterized protein (UPF0333 family)
MTEDEILAGVCVGALALLIIIVLALMAIGSTPFTYRKKSEGGNTTLTVTANRNLSHITVVAKLGNEDIMFERKRIRKGQSVDFVYPSSKVPAKLKVEVESGNVRTAEV